MFVRKVRRRITNQYRSCVRTWKKVRRYLLSLSIIQKIVYKAYLTDEEFVLREYKKRTGKSLNLDHPKTFNEKNNWRKLYDRKEIYTPMVDKYLMKNMIAEKVGAQYTIPLIGVWDKPKDIIWETMPDQFVLKCNHACGVAICRNLRNFDRRRAVFALNARQRTDYYLKHREWPYKNVQRKIIAEKYMGEDLMEYKNYCFNGKSRYIFVWKNHSKKNGFKPDKYFCGAYDRQWNKTDLELNHPLEDIIVEKPACYEEMIRVAEKMAEGEIPFARIDCFIINDKIYISEMTFFPSGGFQRFKNEKWDLLLGDMEKLQGIDY